jgi:hypothetical protein
MCCACGGGDTGGRSNNFGGNKSYNKIPSLAKFPHKFINEKTLHSAIDYSFDKDTNE